MINANRLMQVIEKGILRYAICRIVIFNNCISLTYMRTNAQNDDKDRIVYAFVFN